MPIPSLPEPPRTAIVDKEGMLTLQGRRWFDLLYQKLGQAGKIPTESVDPSVSINSSNDAVADWVDVDASSGVRSWWCGYYLEPLRRNQGWLSDQRAIPFYRTDRQSLQHALFRYLRPGHWNLHRFNRFLRHPKGWCLLGGSSPSQ